jgi:hypothetical protein
VDIALSANSNQKLIPNWDNLDTQPMIILLDEDQDGTYEGEKLADIITDVDDDQGSILPRDFQLGQNYPNPFNPSTTIDYNLPRQGHVTIEVFNTLGQRVQILVDGEQSAGSHSVIWNGANESGQAVATGVYFYRLKTDNRVKTRKMLLLR